MEGRVQLDAIFNLGEVLNSMEEINWEKDVIKHNYNTNLIIGLTNLTDIKSDKYLEIALGSVETVTIKGDKKLRWRLFKLIVKAAKKCNIEFNFNTIVKKLLL